MRCGCNELQGHAGGFPFPAMNRPLTPIERRRQLWALMLAELPPDERDRIREVPYGADAVAFAVAVELVALAQEQQRARNAARLN